jgi:hypothetical protein
MRQLWLRDHVHLARFLPGHPRRKVRTRTIRLHDDQVRLASIAIHTYDIDALAEARVKRIANDDVAYFTPSWTRISRQAGQAFHTKLDTDFTASWTAISRQAGQ